MYEQLNIDDFVDYASEYSRTIKNAKINGDRLIGKCPFHDDNKDSFIADLKTGQCHCFTGCIDGNFISFWAKLNGTDTKDAYKQILEKYNKLEEPKKMKPTKASLKSLTLKEYAFSKKLPEEFLAQICRATTGKDKDGTQFLKLPYYNQDGNAPVFRKRYGNKEFRWSYGSAGKLILYGEWRLEEIRQSGYAILVEGESDTQTLWHLGLAALGVPGASNFKPDMVSALDGLKLYIHKEPDKGGETFLEKVCRILYESDFPGDVYTFSCQQFGVKDPSELYLKDGEAAAEKLKNALQTANRVDIRGIVAAACEDSEAGKYVMTAMDDTEEKNLDWLISGYVPRYQISLLAGDGGSGKTTAWCAIAAAVSSGNKSFLETFIPGDWADVKPQKVCFFSAEDSAEYTLRRRLRKNGAKLENILSIDIADERFQNIKFNSPFLGQLLAANRPALCIFDPIQAFLPPDIHMGERNAMRQALEPLIGYGKKYGITFLIIVHSNKQAGVWGRKRIADSADIWDISRSVLMAGETNENGVRYLSHEKSNYSAAERTVLFTIDDEVVKFKAYTDKKDRDFVTERTFDTKYAPAKNAAIEFIEDFLQNGEKPVSELDQMAKVMSINPHTLRRAKQDMKKAGRLKYRTEAAGKGKGTIYYVSLIAT